MELWGVNGKAVTIGNVKSVSSISNSSSSTATKGALTAVAIGVCAGTVPGECIYF
jgi:hypothetical protein